MNQASEYISNKLHLIQNNPAPCHFLININYAVDREGLVIIKIYDIWGVEVVELVHESKLPGNYSTSWSTKVAQDEVYLVHLAILSRGKRFTTSKRLVLMKW